VTSQNRQSRPWIFRIFLRSCLWQRVLPVTATSTAAGVWQRHLYFMRFVDRSSTKLIQASLSTHAKAKLEIVFDTAPGFEMSLLESKVKQWAFNCEFKVNHTEWSAVVTTTANKRHLHSPIYRHATKQTDRRNTPTSCRTDPGQTKDSVVEIAVGEDVCQTVIVVVGHGRNIQKLLDPDVGRFERIVGLWRGFIYLRWIHFAAVEVLAHCDEPLTHFRSAATIITIHVAANIERNVQHVTFWRHAQTLTLSLFTMKLMPCIFSPLRVRNVVSV